MGGGTSGSLLRQAAGIGSANALNNLAAFGIALASARLLPVEDFGLLGAAMALVVCTATLLDWGLNVSLVRATGRRPELADAAAAFVLASKRLLLLVLAALALVAPDHWLAAGPLDRVTLAATLLSAGLLGCWMGRRAVEQARENFAALREATAACALLRLLTFLLAVLADAVTPLVVLACLYVLPLAGLLGDARAVPAARPGQLLAAGRVLLGYAGWVGLSALCFVAFSRAPLLLLAAAGAPHDAGLFSGALTLTLGLALLGEALRTVALPRIVRARDAAEREAVRGWLRRQAQPVLAAATGGLLVLVLAYEYLLGPAHAGGALLLLVMGLATLAAAGLGLQNALVHAQSRPRVEAAVNVLRLVAFGLLVYALPMTPVALAIAHALVLVAGELALYALVRQLDRRPAPRAASAAAALPPAAALARP